MILSAVRIRALVGWRRTCLVSLRVLRRPRSSGRVRGLRAAGHDGQTQAQRSDNGNVKPPRRQIEPSSTTMPLVLSGRSGSHQRETRTRPTLAITSPVTTSGHCRQG
ncbi:Uncharacterised protein [Mycobacteroides abscessus subsp. abscessus]|nr:Uncharacterised protein [Mycobacteroides abscessus subsp. abscessus]